MVSPLPKALLLTLFVGKSHVFPWTHEAYPNPEKATYYNGAFLIARDVLIYGLMVTLGLTMFCLSPTVDLNPQYSVLPVVGVALLLKGMLLSPLNAGGLYLYVGPVLANVSLDASLKECTHARPLF